MNSTADIIHSKHQYEIFNLLKKEDHNWEDERYAASAGIVDMFNKKSKIVIEYFGDYWHCNPLIYDDNFLNKSLGITAKEKQNKDKIRLQKIINHKSVDMLLVIWEKTFNEIGIDNIMNIIHLKINDPSNKGKIIWI